MHIEWVAPCFEEIKMDAEARSYADDFSTREVMIEPRDAEPAPAAPADDR
jgi:hypothetical protein